MSSRKLRRFLPPISTDARTTVDELQADPDTDRDEKLDDLQKTLEHASDATDDLDNKDT